MTCSDNHEEQIRFNLPFEITRNGLRNRERECEPVVAVWDFIDKLVYACWSFDAREGIK